MLKVLLVLLCLYEDILCFLSKMTIPSKDHFMLLPELPCSKEWSECAFDWKLLAAVQLLVIAN